MIPTDDWIHENNSSLLLDIGNWSQRKWVFQQASATMLILIFNGFTHQLAAATERKGLEKMVWRKRCVQFVTTESWAWQRISMLMWRCVWSRYRHCLHSFLLCTDTDTFPFSLSFSLSLFLLSTPLIPATYPFIVKIIVNNLSAVLKKCNCLFIVFLCIVRISCLQ